MTPVEANIHQAIAAQDWTRKVMLGDPVLTAAQQQAVLAAWRHQRWWRPLATSLARAVMHLGSALLMRKVRVVGRENLPQDRRAIVVSNHFAPLENLAVRKALGNRRLVIVSELTNLAMTGALGWLMRHADTLPIAGDLHYLGRVFPKLLAQRLERAPVLIYPEQSLWLNYRKPRPGQIGAYRYAAELGKPVISLFIEQIEGQWIVHVLKTLTPDATLPARQAARALLQADDAQRQAAYETVYQRPYTLADDPRDFA